ncbi:hypothetical protein V5O39_06705 [Pseudomonas parakoreensis]
MNIDISATAAPHGWVVSLDDCRVYFNQLQEAQAFVSRLQAVSTRRIPGHTQLSIKYLPHPRRPEP